MGLPIEVLVTRPEPGATETAHRLWRMELRPVIAPMLVIETLQPPLPDPASLQAVLAASANAVAAVPAAWHGVPLLAVGDATAARAAEAGFTQAHSADGDATALAGLVARRCRPEDGKLLLAAGEGRGDELARMLRANGYEVQVAEVYAARPATALPEPAIRSIRSDRLLAAMFFSGETARTFVRLADAEREALRRVMAVAIGRAAAVALEALPWRSIRLARRPTQDEMFECLR